MSSEDPSVPVLDAPPIAHRPASNLCRTTATILTWYGISNSIILSTKWLFTNHFPFPLTVTTYSNFLAFLWAALLSCHPKLRAPMPSKHQFWSYIFPIGFTTGLEIGSSNLALKILTVSFGTILKGGAPVFTFMWGLLFGLEQFSLPTFGCLVLIALGIALASLGEGQEFQLGGFCLQLFATALGGLRWAMTHKMLQEDTIRNSTLTRDGNNTISNPQPPIPSHQAMSPLAATLYTAPMTALCVFPFALVLEGSAVWNEDTTNSIHGGSSNPHHEKALILVTTTSIASLVFCLLMSEYWLVQATSSLALSVAAVLKELLTIGGGIFFFAEQLHWLNVVGFVTCQLGIVSYVCLRYERPSATDESYMPVTVEDSTAVLSLETTTQQETFVDEVELPMLCR